MPFSYNPVFSNMEICTDWRTSSGYKIPKTQSEYKCSSSKPGCENTNIVQINSCSEHSSNTSMTVETAAQWDITQTTETALKAI